jgi:hypothetical protein
MRIVAPQKKRIISYSHAAILNKAYSFVHLFSLVLYTIFLNVYTQAGADLA